MNRWVIGLGATLVLVSFAALISWAGSDGGVEVNGIALFVWCAVGIYAFQWLIFVHAWFSQTELFFDLIGGITFIGLMLVALWFSGTQDLRTLVIAGAIIAWALRLAPFLFFRTRNAGEDKRFRQIKTSFPTWLMVWTIQGSWVFVTASCALAAVTSSIHKPLGVFFYLGLLMWLGGFALEIIADRQKSFFRSQAGNEDRFIDTGLWSWSRHPNYFGEIVLWIGVALMSYPVLQGWQLVTLISPIYVIVLLTWISGARILEARADKKWADDPEYQSYKDRTPMMILWPPRSS